MWELKLNSTILRHSKSKLTLIVSILIVNLWSLNYKAASLIFLSLLAYSISEVCDTSITNKVHSGTK